jgi:hypothetical protein
VAWRSVEARGTFLHGLAEVAGALRQRGHEALPVVDEPRWRQAALRQPQKHLDGHGQWLAAARDLARLPQQRIDAG